MRAIFIYFEPSHTTSEMFGEEEPVPGFCQGGSTRVDHLSGSFLGTPKVEREDRRSVLGASGSWGFYCWERVKGHGLGEGRNNDKVKRRLH
jgi:hypothetical protein